ncbi:Ig-like domain-containing protein [Pontibacterium sp.]|uniref:Ig-like domain-containing protein n=1 Tax=Pontibacterium sp. TaxID=2036026 RepID=UPI00351717D6
MTWTSEGQDGSRDTIIGQRFNAQGAKVGDEFQINTFTDASQSSSVVSGLADGGFVVSWVSDGQDGGSKGVFGQRFDSHGDTLGDEFQINSYSKRDQFDPEVTSLSNGGYVMAWTSYAQDGHGYGVYAQQFDAFGARVGDEFLVNSHTRGSQAQPKMTALEDGGFVAVWQSDRQDSSREGIFGQRFDDQGNRVGDEFSVNSTTQGAQISPAIASFASGAFVVTWASAGQDGSGLGIFAQRFDADGAQLGGEFLVNTTTNYSQSAPQVSVLEDGSFVISWTSDRQDGSGKGVFGQRFDADGNIVGDEFQINDHNRFDQTDVAITALRRDSDEPLNHAPTVEDIALTLGEDDAAASIDFSGTDAEGSDLTFTLTSDPVLGSVTNNEDGSFTFDPEDDFQLLNDGESSEVSFTYTATDELGKTSAEGTVTVNVTGQDDIDPTNLFKITSTNFAETDDLLAAVQAEFGADYVLADWQDIVRAYNEFGEAYFEDLMSGQEVMITKDGENFLEEHAGRQYLVADHDGSVPTNWGVHDHINGNDLSLGSWYGLNLPVMAVHEDYAPLNYTSTTPEVADINIIASEGYAVEANFAGSDANLDNLTFELTSLPDQGTVINNNDGSFSFQLEDASDLNSGESAQTSFTYKACDGENSSDNANVSITLTGQDQLLEGGFVVAWSSFRQDGGDWGIYGQRYDADGNTFGDEFLINSITTNCQTEPAITSLSDGGFVVSWTSMNEDGSGSGVFAQRYGVDGNTDGAVIQVNSYTEGVQGNSALAATSDGGFVAVWNSTHQDGSNKGVFGQRFNVEGEATGDEFQINTFSRWDQHDPAITMLANDGFVVSWTSLAQDGRGWGIFGQQFDSDGNAQGTEFQINTYTRNNQTESSITALSDGGFVVTWESDRQDGSGRGIYGQRFDANGDSQGGEFLINTETSGNQTAPVVTDLDDGGFIVVWSSSNQDGSGNGIYGQRFDSDAQALGEEFQINTETSRSQDDASVAALDEGGFVVTWHSDSQDGSGGGVFGQRFDTDGNTIGGEFQVNSYTHMHQADAVVTGLNSDDLISEPTSFMFTSTIYSNGNQIDVLDSDDSFQLSQLAEEITGIDTVDLSGTETNSVQISEAALLARTDDDDTLFVTGDFGDSVNLTGDGWAQINPVETYSVATDWFTNGDAIVVVDQALDIQSEYDLLDLTV